MRREEKTDQKRKIKQATLMQSDKTEDEAQPKQPQSNKTGATIESQTTAAEQKRAAEKMQAALKQLVIQLKNGCKKQFCFNKLCRKNFMGTCLFPAFKFEFLEPVTRHFANDREMLKFAIDTLKTRQSELDELICSDTTTCNL